MISKSTKAKRRKNAKLLSMFKQLRVLNIDNRNGCDSWIVSTPGRHKSESIHFECSSYKKTVKTFREICETIRLEDTLADIGPISWKSLYYQLNAIKRH